MIKSTKLIILGPLKEIFFSLSLYLLKSFKERDGLSAS